MHEVTKLSAALRGELISKIKNHQVHIIGGDLSYGKINSPLMRISKPNIIYHPATVDYSETMSIYANSKININISSLQFDTAINNRIVDIVLSGGFLITDYRSDLIELCPAAQLISFESPEHMNYLIDFYMHPANEKIYQSVKQLIYSEFVRAFSYNKSISMILENI